MCLCITNILYARNVVAFDEVWMIEQAFYVKGVLVVVLESGFVKRDIALFGQEAKSEESVEYFCN